MRGMSLYSACPRISRALASLTRAPLYRLRAPTSAHLVDRVSLHLICEELLSVAVLWVELYSRIQPRFLTFSGWEKWEAISTIWEVGTEEGGDEGWNWLMEEKLNGLWERDAVWIRQELANMPMSDSSYKVEHPVAFATYLPTDGVCGFHITKSTGHSYEMNICLSFDWLRCIYRSCAEMYGTEQTMPKNKGRQA
ncbi:uncharacterized protein HD556DRAFT_1437887 [Suillus plorans]|uniref:Uncharacterized protein n=1 Tax=Suillus plorans TaxID=116603 RepID=A0A9P7J4X6_9AGAM|nr:uncharacterized protein HD556DRAFT_1437887 [Suillus plorans]KAG1802820.1 hypothetical protein HD556DRAFT_1437887 [Suillus plorans]